MQDRILVECVDPSELDVVARVLAEAYTADPIHLWAMPKADTRLADATMFFKFYLQRMRAYSWEVLSTADRSAVLVTWPVHQGKSGYPDGGVRYMPTLLRTKSRVNDYIRWIENFRPKVDHQYLEFIGVLPSQHSRGLGSLLLGNLIAKAGRENMPVWAWSSNPRNLSFYSRLGFEIGETVRMNESTPPVTPIWHPPVQEKVKEENI